MILNLIRDLLALPLACCIWPPYTGDRAKKEGKGYSNFIIANMLKESK